MKICSFLLLLSIFGLSLCGNPGLKVKFTQKGLDFGFQLGIDQLQKRLKEGIFEDWNGHQTFVVGEVDYTISNIHIDSVKFPDNSMSLIPGTGINITISDAGAAISADWKVRSWVHKNSGKLTASVSGTSVEGVVTVSRDEAGRPKFLLEHCQAEIGNIQIKLSKEAGWMYHYLVSIMEKPSRLSLSSNMCPLLELAVEQANEDLKKYQTQAQIDAFVEVDYSLVNSLAVLNESIDFDFKGKFYPVGKSTEPPFEPVPFVIPDNDDFMVHIGLSDYFFHSASWAYYTSGAFEISTIKEFSSFFNLTTRAFNNILGVAHKYPKPYPVLFNATAVAPPQLILQDNSSYLEFTVIMEVLAAPSDSALESMFTFNLVSRCFFEKTKWGKQMRNAVWREEMTTRAHVTLNIFEQKLIAALCLDSFHLVLVHSNVGFFKGSLLKNFTNYILRNGVIPGANAYLKAGFPILKMDPLMLVDPLITVHQGFLMISTDLKCKDSGEKRSHHSEENSE